MVEFRSRLIQAYLYGISRREAHPAQRSRGVRRWETWVKPIPDSLLNTRQDVSFFRSCPGVRAENHVSYVHLLLASLEGSFRRRGTLLRLGVRANQDRAGLAFSFPAPGAVNPQFLHTSSISPLHMRKSMELGCDQINQEGGVNVNAFHNIIYENTPPIMNTRDACTTRNSFRLYQRSVRRNVIDHATFENLYFLFPKLLIFKTYLTARDPIIQVVIGYQCTKETDLKL